MEPLHSLVIVCGKAPCETVKAPPQRECDLALRHWKRSICDAKAYPCFSDTKEVKIPDNLAEERPTFSGFVRYETTFHWSGTHCALEIEDAGECVEVFLNGESLGLQLIPPFRYDLSAKLKSGENQLAIEVATTLERQMCPQLSGYQKMLAHEPQAMSGLTGNVSLKGQLNYIAEKPKSAIVSCTL